MAGEITADHTFVDGETVSAATLNNLLAGLRVADNAITTAKIVDGAVTASKLAPSLNLGAGQIGLASAKFLLGNGSNVGVAGTFGTTLAVTGTTLDVAAGGIGTTQLANGAVALAKLANLTDARLIGRSAGSAGVPQEIQARDGVALSGGALTWATAVNVTTGTGSAYAVTTGFSLAGLVDGKRLVLRLNADCAATPTLAVDGLAAKALRTNADTPLNAQDLVSGMVGEVVYVAAANSAAGAWLWLGPLSGGPALQLVFDGTVSAVTFTSSPGVWTTTVIGGSPVFTFSGHGLNTGDVCWFITHASTLATGFTANVPYYATRIDAATFKLSASRADLAAGTFQNSTATTSVRIVRWNSDPLMSRSGVDGVCRIEDGSSAGQYVLGLSASMASVNYAVFTNFYMSGFGVTEVSPVTRDHTTVQLTAYDRKDATPRDCEYICVQILKP